jgi:membrane fusion protein (multidrug efflux system)
MNRPLLFAILLTGAALAPAVLSACNAGDKAAAGKPGPGAPGAAPPARLPAIVLASTVSDGSGVSVPGTVLAEQQVDIQTEISGKVVEIGFREGEPVKAGQVLARLEDAELKARAGQASARLLLARTRERRLKQDLQAQAVSQGEYDQAAADLKAAEADAALAKAQWEKTVLRAPFAGSAGLREVDAGSVVQSGARVTTLQNLSSLRVEFSVPEKQAESVRAGLKVRFTTAGSGDTLEATVYAVESRIDADTRLLRVRARCERPRGRVLPGAFARVELPLAADSALWVPTQAVVQSARGAMVWRVQAGVAGLTVFTPGTRDAQSVEVAAGLEAGDTVLISGLMQLRPGAAVIPVVANPAAPAP